MYSAPGNIVDYMYARAGIKYAYAAFLRDTGTVSIAGFDSSTLPSVLIDIYVCQYGFVLPPEWIRPVGEETANMVNYIARFIAKQKKINL